MEGRTKQEEGPGPSSFPLPPSPGRGVEVGAIVVAAGSGARMGGVDKLFAPLAGRPLLAHTLAAFAACPAVDRLVLVLSSASLERGRALLDEVAPGRGWRVCAGGARRQDSVRLGLAALGACEWVAVHDGARPLVTPELIRGGLEAACETGAAVPAVPLADTVKEAGPDGLVVRTLDRSRLYAVQTPQVFRYDLFFRAHREVTAGVTDDAAMLEALGLPVKLFPGDRNNIKVTTPEDMRFVEALLKTEPQPVTHDP
ncbi:MAG TPA: 2-C-methyl-D-erythritol 4-phosphate cytidylyltransferase [Dehalococcoidia bacterium]|nr:2-C-methyl-D-erythritol 4-phosphate cytidylyltransferase [Dehalococcoidia bacterium]